MVPKSISYIYNVHDDVFGNAIVVYTDTFGPMWEVAAYWENGYVDTYETPFESVLCDWDSMNKQNVPFYVVDNWE